MPPKKRVIGGNTKILKPNKLARASILAQQKQQLREYKYDLQAKVRSDLSGPHSGAIASQGSLSSFKITPRNPKAEIQKKKPLPMVRIKPKKSNIVKPINKTRKRSK
jgi:hypothetical protein